MTPYLYALGAILCWASLPAATGSGLVELTTPELMFFSFTAAAIYLYLQDLVVKRSARVFLPPLPASLFGVTGIFVYHFVYYLALERAPLAEGAILATTWSLWIVIFSSILRLKRLAPSMIVTAVLGFAGAALVIGGGKELSFQAAAMPGYLLALCCGLIWSSFSVALPYLKIKEEPMTAFTIYAAICSAILYVCTGPYEMPSLQALLSATYLGCVPLGLSFFLWNRAVTTGNMVIVGFLSYLTPPLAVLLVALVHGQKINTSVIWGMCLIIGASLLGRLRLNMLEKGGTK
ncbi:DMT family transporter [Desulfosediminicola sp.]